LKRFVKIVLVLSILALMGVGAVLGLFTWVASDLPEINSLADYRPPMNSRIFARDGEVLLDIGKETRDVVAFKQIPARVVNAFLAAEDDNFWHHSGVDYRGIARAFMVNLKEGRLVQGGSTITQQVAKSLLLSKERTLSRKIKDLLLAQKIEEKFSKEDILYLYLNQVYLGGGYYGVKAAFRGYFDKDLKDASIAESALVAGLLVAPGRYSPYVNPQYAKRRQLYVLERMHATGKITSEEHEAARKEDIRMRLRETSGVRGGHFTDWVRQEVIKKVGEEEFLTQGFQVQTTLDLTLQTQAEEAVLKHVKELDKRQGFKGAMGNLQGDGAIAAEFRSQRQQIYRSSSSYFHFSTDGANLFEFQFSDAEFDKLRVEAREEHEKLDARYKGAVVIGNAKEDRLVGLLKKGVSYRAVVEKVDDGQRMIYASVGGARVAIPESGFTWAHQRMLDEESRWFPPVTKPSTVLKTGDQILVRVTGENQSVWPLLFSDYKKKNSDLALSKIFQAQKFVIAELDQKPEAEGAFVALSTSGGQVLAMVGGVDFTRSQFNRALQAQRQPGSSFKPFIYAAALEEGYTPATILLDTPQALGGNNDNLSWKPRNYDGEFLGPMTFRKALEVSRNIPTVRILQDVGVEKTTAFSKRIGIRAQLPSDMSMSLGSFGISLTELVKGYAVLANGGRRLSIKAVSSVKDRYGKAFTVDVDPMVEPPSSAEPDRNSVSSEDVDLETDWRKNLTTHQVYDPRLAFIMTNILKGVIQVGTGSGARGLSDNIAGKTGTTNNYVDALFVGYSATVVAGAWVGLDDNRPLGYGETGGKTALPIWMDVMRVAISKYGAPEFPVPDGLMTIAINRETGRPALPGQEGDFTETFAIGMEPSRERSSTTTGTDPGEKPAALEDEGYYLNQ
jgi:penicillin-binding protein 1A